MDKKLKGYANLESNHIQFYKNLKKEQIGNISPEKINEIERFALVFPGSKYRDLKLRFASAIEKAYLGYSSHNITCYVPKKKVQGYVEEQRGNTVVLPIDNDAEILLFIMFVTDPEFVLLRHSANKKTLEEMKTACNRYAYFWDLQLLIIEQKFTKLMLSRQSELLENNGDDLTIESNQNEKQKKF